jgi:hypothetical protein
MTRDMIAKATRQGREYRRFSLKSAVEFTRWDPKNNVFGFVTDISVGGARVETTFPAPIGADVLIRAWPPGWDEEILLAAVVRWKSSAGMGVEFISIGPHEALAIHALVMDHKRRAEKTHAA